MTGVEIWPMLLLSFSLLSMGKAACPFPVLNGKIILSPESIQKNHFPDDSKASVVCVKGYEIENGSDLITCVNGAWSAVELNCKKIDCGLPKASPHMNYSIPNGTLFGALIKSYCERGYDFEGSSFRQCLVTGWSGDSKCILITCEEPASIAHGTFSKPRTIPELDDVIQYSCDDNYTLVGDRSITCGENWEYSSSPPTCKEIECSVPEISFGNQTEGNPPYFYKSEATFECWPGYRMDGLATSVCEERGWSALPVCVKEIECSVPEISFGNQTEGNPPYFYKSEATFECWPGYRMEGLATSVCEERGWSALPVCVKVIIAQTTASTTTNKATTKATFTATTHSNGRYGGQLITHLLSAMLGAMLGVGLVVLVFFAVICACLCFKSKQRGSYNTGEERRTKVELLLYQSL